MFKLLYKLLSVILITAALYVSCCSASDSGVMPDEVYIPPPPYAVQELPEPEVVQAEPGSSIKLNGELPSESQPQDAQSDQEKPSVNPEKSFGGLFTNMLSALGKTVILILAFTGIYLLIKRIRAGKIPIKVKENEIKEPKTIEEAVSSYIKHKLKK